MPNIVSDWECAFNCNENENTPHKYDQVDLDVDIETNVQNHGDIILNYIYIV